MASYWSGLVSSVKSYLGYDNLEVESTGNTSGVDQQEHNWKDEQRQGLWSQLSKFIGKDITSMISLPVWIFEPLSFLQIMCEPMQYAELLIKASESPDPANRMAYLIAWITSGYSCAVRNRKPFNPLLGETFEYLSQDDKWKFFAEQVSHHPPIGVAVANGKDWELRLEMELKTNFRGNSADVNVLGTNSFQTKYGDYFTWGHLGTTAHNVIIGGMWVDHYGTLEVKNKTGERAVVNYTRTGWLGSGRFDLNGEIYDSKGNLKLKLTGKWNEIVMATKVNHDASASQPLLVWKRAHKIANPTWGWTAATSHLNHLDDEYKAILPSNDSRLRLDRFYLEKGDITNAGKEKIRLEEKQRTERKEREAKGDHYHAKYFQKTEGQEGSRWTSIKDYWADREERVKAHKESNVNNNAHIKLDATPAENSSPAPERPIELEEEINDLEPVVEQLENFSLENK